MKPLYDEDHFPFTVEDWTDRNNIEILACATNAFAINKAWEAYVEQKPGRKLVSRHNRAHTMRRSWESD